MLGLGADGRLVVAELKSGRTPDTEVTAVKYAAMVSRTLPESLADHYARFQSRRQTPMSAEEALAELQAHAPDLSQESLRRPRIVLLARDFSPIVTASVVWLSEMGLDISLVQISAFRSYVYGQSGSGNVPMISVSQLYPLREVEEFTISPERQLAKEMAESKRRVQDASTVRRLVTAESVADGTLFTLSPRNDISFDMRIQLEEWLDAEPARRTAHWQNSVNAPLVWDVDKAAYTPAGLARHIVEQATGMSDDFFGTQWWRDPTGWTMAELAGPLGGGKGALYREYWSRWLDKVRVQHAHWTPMSTLPAQNFITLPGPHQGHPLRAELRGGRPAAIGLLHRPRFPGVERGAVRGDPGATGAGRVDLRRAAVLGAAARTRRLPDRRLHRGRGHVRRGPRLLHRLDDRVAGTAARGRRRRAAHANRRRSTTSTGADAGRHDVFSFQVASGAKTTMSPTVHSSAGTR